MNENSAWYGREAVSPGNAETVSLVSESEMHRKLREDCAYYLLLAAAEDQRTQPDVPAQDQPADPLAGVHFVAAEGVGLDAEP